MKRFFSTVAVILFSLMLAFAQSKTHLDWARILVNEVRAESTSYQHKQGFVKWKGQDGATAYESHTDCSGFINALLAQAYGFKRDRFETWMHKPRPLAVDYHDAILDHRGFALVQNVRDIRPGDIIAIKYPPDAENSGHLMLVSATPTHRSATAPEIEATEQWEVRVIDSSRSGHGKLDTRRKDDGSFGSGVGEGIFRLYATRAGKIAGYTWSTFANSDYYSQQDRELVVGRLDLSFKP